MISALDCMDIDVSYRLGLFIESRVNFNKVMKQLEDYAEYNIRLQYPSMDELAISKALIGLLCMDIHKI